MADHEFDVFNSSCLNLTKYYFIGAGISGLVCSLLLGLIIVFEVIYTCRNKTTFHQRLFLYFTIAATLAEVPFLILLGHNSELSEDSCWILYYSTIFLQYHTLFVELLVIGSLNLTLLSKLYKYRVSRRSQDPGAEYMLCCCYYNKWREVLFCVIVLIATQVLPSVLFIASIFHKPFITDFRLPPIFFIGYEIIACLYAIVFILDVVLTVISITVLVYWIHRLRRQNILRNKMKLVCREISLVVGFMASFLAGLVLLVVFLYFQILAVMVLFNSSIVFIINPFLHVIAPALFLLYICTSTQNSQQDTQRQHNSTLPTAPPSTRVSLPTDTAAHVPNFLSPSTAEPTEETSLIKN